MSNLNYILTEAIKNAIYESLFDDIDDIISDSNDDITILNDISNNYKYVNLGLPSGTLWCTKNLGAKNELDFGNYYQWGYTEPTSQTRLGKGNYKKFNPSGNGKTFTKYSKNKVHYQLEDIDDAAYLETNGNYKIPTPELFEELIKYCKWKWCDKINNTNISGYKIMSKKRDNKEYIYLPAAGSIQNLLSFYDIGLYWTSYNTSDPKYMDMYYNNIKAYAQCLYFSSDLHYETELPHIILKPRFYAFSIRPVLNND